MTRATFAKALSAAVPELVLSDEHSSRSAPEGYTEVGFQLVPVSDGFRLSIKIGEEPLHQFRFSSEEEAAAFVGRMYTTATEAPAS